jgi:hypothetical protein
VIELAFRRAANLCGRDKTRLLNASIAPNPPQPVERKGDPSSPVCCFDRTGFLLQAGTLLPKAQIANPAPATNKKLRPKVSSGKSLPCRYGCARKAPHHDSSPSRDQDHAEKCFRTHSKPAPGA